MNNHLGFNLMTGINGKLPSMNSAAVRFNIWPINTSMILITLYTPSQLYSEANAVGNIQGVFFLTGTPLKS